MCIRDSSNPDKLWCIALLSGRKPKRTVNTNLLRQWAAEISEIPLWLFEESYHTVGDLAETIAILVPGEMNQNQRCLSEWMSDLKSLANADESEKKRFVTEAWAGLDSSARFVFNKLITGGFRVGVSQKLVVKALSRLLSKPENEIAHALMGDWEPFSVDFDSLLINKNL